MLSNPVTALISYFAAGAFQVRCELLTVRTCVSKMLRMLKNILNKCVVVVALDLSPAFSAPYMVIGYPNSDF